MEHYPPYQPSSEEALDAFLDGELPSGQEQALFDELQSSPELRNVMKDTLSIRRAVHKDAMVAPAVSESALLAAVGLGGTAATGGALGLGAGGAAGTALSGAAATTSLLRSLTPVLTAGGGLVAGFFLAYAVFSGSPSSTAVAGSTAAERAPIPTTQTSPLPTVAAAPDTVYQVRYVRAEPQAQPVMPAPAENTELETPPTLSTTSVEPIAASVVRNFNTEAIDQVQPMTMESTAMTSIPVTFRARSLASGLRSTEPMPAAVRDAVLPNTAFGLLFPLSENHAVGIEMGTESFRQEFTGTYDNRQVQYIQTPLLFWMGATYRWTPLRFDFLPGLTAFTEATIGMAVQQGPLARTTIGLQYQPIGPLQLTVGIDAAALAYRHEGAWFSSTKWGPALGIGFQLGALR